MKSSEFLVNAIGLVCTLVVPYTVQDLHAPCYHCEFFNYGMQKDQPYNTKKRQELIEKKCAFPCQCAPDHATQACRAGVKRIKDGCNCCFMCARQQGEYCDNNMLCGETFKCDTSRSGGPSGICRAIQAEPCLVDGDIYKDGEQFKPDCRRLCTCQNGHYGCVSLCPQENKQPSKKCANPRLVSIKNKCCKEWVCDRLLADMPLGLKTHSSNKPKQKYPDTGSNSIMPIMPKAPCLRTTSAWSACSVTCGMGLSIRVTNDNAECKSKQQIRFCQIRPCDLINGKFDGGRCTPTIRPKTPIELSYKDCVSKRQYRPKFCSACKKNKCCKPHQTKTKAIPFICKHGRKEMKDFMWIKNCKCHKDC
ncbi:CCN family member 2-like [Tubulanus polymorphus]|uniref:CCN family member 2-like n=1 Tax=Tubulanus polymorphus TaxID=672921 RepID=UPI003DA602A9